MAPGRTCRPVASNVSRDGGMASVAPTARMRPSLIAMLPATVASGETIVPSRMIRSAVTVIAVPHNIVLRKLRSQHGPAAVDRKIDAGDLARRVAGKEQAGIGDVAVDSDALERIF